MAVMTYREALNLALREELKRDPDRLRHRRGGRASTRAPTRSPGLLKEFRNPKRIVDTPIAESGFTGVGIARPWSGCVPWSR